MKKFTNDDFIEFITSFHNFHDEISEISKNTRGQPLIDNDFKMYSLDDMCWDCKLLEDNTPKTTDALFYKLNDNKLTLYLVEFKFHNLNNPNCRDLFRAIVDDIYDSSNKKYKCLSDKFKSQLNKIKRYYADDIEYSLILKPIESINIVIPSLYKEYCMENNIEEKDIRSFLNNIEKKVFVFVSDYSPGGKRNIQRHRLEPMASGLNSHFQRLVNGEIIDYHKIYSRDNWEYFLEYEELI